MLALTAAGVAVDFDGTLVEHGVSPPRWRPWAKQFILAAAASGMRVILHSCRCGSFAALDDDLAGDEELTWATGAPTPAALASWLLHEEMRAFLIAEGVWHLLEPWTAPGKPHAVRYLDDLAGDPEFLVAAAELGLRLLHGQQEGPGQLLQRPAATLAAEPAAAGAAAAAPGPATGLPVGR